jgi:hypothetical protein
MERLLERYFFSFIDLGCEPENTPLFSGTVDDRPLRDVLSEDYIELQPHEIHELILCARKEVELV